MKKNVVRGIAAAAVLMVTLASVTGWFWMLSTAAQDNIPDFLTPDRETQKGWRYRVNGKSAEPAWSAEGYLLGLPAEAERAEVSASVVLGTEYEDRGYLSFMLNARSLRVTLDGELLYEGRVDGGETARTVYVSLPEERVGKNLTVTVEDDVYDGFIHPVFPSGLNEKAFYASYVADDVKSIALSAAAGAAAVLVSLFFVFSLHKGATDWRILLLLLFALLYMLTAAADSFALDAHYPGETAVSAFSVLSLPGRLYLDVLLLFFAAYMERAHRILLISGVGLHAVWLGILFFRGELLILEPLQTAPFLILLLLTFALLLAERRKSEIFRAVLWGAAPAALYAAAGAALVLTGDRSEWVMPLESAFYGNFYPLSEVLSVYLSLVTGAVLMVSFIKRQTENQVLLQTTRMQAQYAAENAASLNEAVERGRKARHEYRHHLEALLALCAGGDMERVKGYVSALCRTDKEEPVLVYTGHPVVNALISACGVRCRERKVRFNASVQVPARLNVEDADLTVLLSNLLENAVEAVGALPVEERRITLKMALYNGSELYVDCENPYLKGSVKEKDGSFLSSKAGSGHGYGIRAMRQVSQKYHGALVINRTEEIFQVKTCLSVPRDRQE